MAIVNTSNQIVISVVYSALLAVISYGYSAEPRVDHSWLYATTGFAATFVALSSNVAGKQKQMSQVQTIYPFSSELAADAEKIIGGATIGALIGFVTYFVFYFWPESVLTIPGSVKFFSFLMNTSDELMSYWIVQVLVILSALVYLFAAGFPILIAGAMLIFSRFGSNKPSEPSEPSNSDERNATNA
jgi:hypothetical protein